MEKHARKRTQGLTDSWGLLVTLRSGATSHKSHHVRSSTKKSFKKEGGHVFKAEHYAIGQLGIFGIYATCKMPLQTVLISLDLPSQRAGLGSLKLGELRKAAQFTYNVLVLVA